MSEMVTFVPYGRTGYEAAFLGVHFIGAVRERPGGGGEWIFLLDPPAGDRAAASWQRARNLDEAKAQLKERVADWYDAAHQPLAQSQGERIARLMAGLR